MATEERSIPDDELAKHYEALLGREVGVEELAEIVFRVTVGLYTVEDGRRTSRSIAGGLPPIKSCDRAKIHTISGIATTRADGKIAFKLSDFHCSVMAPVAPVILVATAHTRSPVFVTTFTTLTDGANPDVNIELFSWNQNGNPAGGVPVRWFCRVRDALGGVE